MYYRINFEKWPEAKGILDNVLVPEEVVKSRIDWFNSPETPKHPDGYDEWLKRTALKKYIQWYEDWAHEVKNLNPESQEWAVEDQETLISFPLTDMIMQVAASTGCLKEENIEAI